MSSTTISQTTSRTTCTESDVPDELGRRLVEFHICHSAVLIRFRVLLSPSSLPTMPSKRETSFPFSEKPRLRFLTSLKRWPCTVAVAVAEDEVVVVVEDGAATAEEVVEAEATEAPGPTAMAVVGADQVTLQDGNLRRYPPSPPTRFSGPVHTLRFSLTALAYSIVWPHVPYYRLHTIA